ncbi:hypothetical protein, partial [Xanthomonas sp. WCS2017Cala2-12]|uniref:hypothetical protein n=1 Tax=Xanthomonas sp. WCS2017Cala2-12 TaxID=3073639 RepID=UPI002889ECFB
TNTNDSSTLIFETPLIGNGTNAIIKIPAKETGTYTLATTGDATLQNVLENGSNAFLSGESGDYGNTVQF